MYESSRSALDLVEIVIQGGVDLGHGLACIERVGWWVAL